MPAPKQPEFHFEIPTVIIPAVRIPQPDGSLLIKPGKPYLAEPVISSAEAARLLGMSQRAINQQCSEGHFKSAIKPGGRPRSPWKITRQEVLSRLNPPSN